MAKSYTGTMGGKSTKGNKGAKQVTRKPNGGQTVKKKK